MVDIISVSVLEYLLPWQKETQHISSDTFSWYFVAFALATPERPADSFLFMCAHLLQPLCHGCEPLYRLILDLKKIKMCDWLPKAEVTFEVQQRRLSRLLIHMCSGRGKAYKKKKKAYFFPAGYEMVTFAGVVWG